MKPESAGIEPLASMLAFDPRAPIAYLSPMLLFLSKAVGALVSPLGLLCLLLAVAAAGFRGYPRSARASVCLALALVLVCGNRLASLAIAHQLESSYPPSDLPAAQAIVLLTAGTKPASPPQPLVWMDSATANRALYVAELFKEGKAPLIIVSGGKLAGAESFPSLADDTAAILERMGVPAGAIVKESSSRNTYENAVDVTAILHQRKIERVLLVTSAMHMPRAMLNFEEQGVDAVPAPTDFQATGAAFSETTSSLEQMVFAFMPSPDSFVLSGSAIKEYLGLTVYHLMYWLRPRRHRLEKTGDANKPDASRRDSHRRDIALGTFHADTLAPMGIGT